MQSLQSLQHKLESATNLISIVRTMKAHASSNISQFQHAAQASSKYRNILDMALHVVLSEDNEYDPPSYDMPREGIGIHIVFGSDHGLAGRFNERIYSYATDQIDIKSDDVVIVIGNQLLRRMESQYSIEASLSVPQTEDGITPVVQRLLLKIDEIRIKQSVSFIYLHYCNPKDIGGFSEETEILFPMNLNKISNRNIQWKSKSIPTFFMDRDKLMSDLLKQYYFITIYRSFCYSLVSENTTRIDSMKNAERNIEERMEELRFKYRTQRQNVITEEINDVISGFKAIKKNKE
ncbi:MAG TPA: hypothetical protein DCG38_07545 [Eubacteriaceae bacterium]|nr:hypothetical protein [Eubacteriaceae bacterium]